LTSPAFTSDRLDPAGRILWAYLQFAAASLESQLPQFDGTLLHCVVPERILDEPTTSLLEQLLDYGAIRCWSTMTPTPNALPNGNPHGHHRLTVLVDGEQFLALCAKQGGGEGPDAPPAAG
jgi:hypothetical protein